MLKKNIECTYSTVRLKKPRFAGTVLSSPARIFAKYEQNFRSKLIRLIVDLPFALVEGFRQWTRGGKKKKANDLSSPLFPPLRFMRIKNEVFGGGVLL